MIPCKELKCLKYPACKNKTEIHCLDLLKYFTDTRNEYKETNNFVARHDHAWLMVTKVFPSIIISTLREVLQRQPDKRESHPLHGGRNPRRATGAV